MRVVFCGSGSFAVPSLQSILADNHEIVCVVTQPPRRAGRGGKVRPTDVAVLARELGLDLLETANINSDESVARLAPSKPDVICVVEFGQMVRQRVRDLARLDAFNLHGSLLPVLRGAAPVNWAIIRGLKETGVTTFSLVDRMDAGDVFIRKATRILPNETAACLRGRLAEIGAEVVCSTLGLLDAGWAKAEPQESEGVTLAPQMKKSDGIIDWSAPAETIANLVHGTWPWPGGHAVFAPRHGMLVPLTLASVRLEAGGDGRPGTIDETLAVNTGCGLLRIDELRPAGKRLMKWKAFVNGHHVRRGDLFVTTENAQDG